MAQNSNGTFGNITPWRPDSNTGRVTGQIGRPAPAANPYGQTLGALGGALGYGAQGEGTPSANLFPNIDDPDQPAIGRALRGVQLNLDGVPQSQNVEDRRDDMAITVQRDGQYLNIPLSFEGRRLNEDEAFDLFKQGHIAPVGRYGSMSDALAASNAMSDMQRRRRLTGAR